MMMREMTTTGMIITVRLMVIRTTTMTAAVINKSMSITLENHCLQITKIVFAVKIYTNNV